MNIYIVTSCHWDNKLQEYLYESVKVLADSEISAIFKSNLTDEIIDVQKIKLASLNHTDLSCFCYIPRNHSCLEETK